MSAVNRNLTAGTWHILMAVGRLNHIAAMIATDGVTNYFSHDDTSILLKIREKPVISDWLQLVKKDFDKLVDGGASSPATATPTSFC